MCFPKAIYRSLCLQNIQRLLEQNSRYQDEPGIRNPGVKNNKQPQVESSTKRVNNVEVLVWLLHFARSFWTQFRWRLKLTDADLLDHKGLMVCLLC